MGKKLAEPFQSSLTAAVEDKTKPSIFLHVFGEWALQIYNNIAFAVLELP